MCEARPVAVFYAIDPKDRQKEPLPPMVSAHCDWCGCAVETLTRRGEVSKFCGGDCRAQQKAAEKRAGAFLYSAVRDARLFKHSNATRSNAARSAIAEFMAEHFDELDTMRRAMTDADGVARITTSEAKKRG